MSRIRVLMIEDNCLMSQGATTLLNAQPDIRAVCVSSGNGSIAEKVISFKPHVALVNVDSTRTEGSIAIRKVRKEAPKAAIILTNVSPGNADMMDFIRDEVSGFIQRNANLDDWLSTIRSVAQGQKVLPAVLSADLFSQIVNDSAHSGVGELPARGVRMTRREAEVTELVARGFSNKEIAIELCLSVHTVKSHVHNILEKLALGSRLELAHRVLTSHVAADNSSHGPAFNGYFNP